MQDTGSLLLGLALNKWLILAVASCVFSFVVRLLLGPVRGQDIAGLSLAPVLAGVMVILIGQALFTKPAPGNNWALSWEWRIDQVLVLFTALGWVLGLLLDLMRRPMSLSLMFGLIAGLGYSIAFLILLVPTGPSLPELFSKTVTFSLLLTFIVWRFAQTDPGYTVLRSLQLTVAAVGAAAGGLHHAVGRPRRGAHRGVRAGVCASVSGGLADVDGGRPWVEPWCSRAVRGLSPFLLFIGYLVLVEEAMSLYAGALIVLMLTGPDLVSGFERRSGIGADRIPVWNRSSIWR